MSEVAAAVPAAPVAPPPAAPAPETGPAADAGATAPEQPQADKATATPPEGEKKSDTDDATEKRQSRRFERKIDKLHRRAAEAQARAEILEKELQQYRQPKAEAGAPKLEDFKDIEEYATAKAKFEADRVLKEHQAKQRTETQKAAQAKLTQSWEEKTARGSDKYEDFEDVVGEVQPTSPAAIAIMRAANGEEIAYHLAKNHKEAQRIAALDPVDQLLEIGLLSAKLAAEPPKPKTPSKAPAPISPLSGTAPAVSAAPSETDDMKTWMSKRQKQVHRR